MSGYTTLIVLPFSSGSGDQDSISVFFYVWSSTFLCNLGVLMAFGFLVLGVFGLWGVGATCRRFRFFFSFFFTLVFFFFLFFYICLFLVFGFFVLLSAFFVFFFFLIFFFSNSVCLMVLAGCQLLDAEGRMCKRGGVGEERNGGILMG